MPVRKFRGVAEMNATVWRRVGDPGLVRAIASVWAFGGQTGSQRFSPGVRRFRSLAEMKASISSGRP
jgi:hypothetical protein